MNSTAMTSNAHAGFRKMERTRFNNGQARLLSLEEAASLLQVSKGMVYKLVREGRLEAVRMGRLVCISPESYDDLIARCGARGRDGACEGMRAPFSRRNTRSGERCHQFGSVICATINRYADFMIKYQCECL